MGREDPVAQRMDSRSFILSDARPQSRRKQANSRSSSSQKKHPVKSDEDDEDILDAGEDDPFSALSDPDGRLMSEPSVISVASISKSSSVASVHKNTSIASGSYIAANANHQDRSVASSRGRGEHEEEESKEELTLSPFDYSVDTTVPVRGGNSMRAYSRPSDKIRFGSDWEVQEEDGESSSKSHKSDSQVEAAVNGNHKSTAQVPEAKSTAGPPSSSTSSLWSKKTTLVIAALVLLVVILAVVVIVVSVDQNDSASNASQNNPNSTTMSPSTMPVATQPLSPPTPSMMTQPPITIPSLLPPTPPPGGTTPAAPMAPVIPAPTQVPVTSAPSVCQSTDCVKNELLPFLPSSTLAKLNEPGTCQNSALGWIAPSGLERIAQRYALAVLSCEMKFPTEGFWVGDSNECDWLTSMSGGNPCNGDDFVDFLPLSGKQLTGTLPSELSILSTLAVIDFSSNNISGNIPSELGKLTLLEQLLLGNNDLTGSVPKEICDLRSNNMTLNILEVDCPSLDYLSQQQRGVNCSCCQDNCVQQQTQIP